MSSNENNSVSVSRSQDFLRHNMEKYADVLDLIARLPQLMQDILVSCIVGDYWEVSQGWYSIPCDQLCTACGYSNSDKMRRNLLDAAIELSWVRTGILLEDDMSECVRPMNIVAKLYFGDGNVLLRFDDFFARMYLHVSHECDCHPYY